MDQMTIYKDVPWVFVAYVDIRGTTTSNTKARLLIKLGRMTLLFEGTVNGNQVTVKVPKLSGIEESIANIALEVIADEVYFEPYTAIATLEYKMAVEVQDVQVEQEQVTITVGEVTAVEDTEATSAGRTDETPAEVLTIPEDKQVERSGLYRPDCKPSHKRFVKASIAGYDKLEKDQKASIRHIIRSYEPNEDVNSWGLSVFNDMEEFLARYCMYALENSLAETNKG